MSLVWFMAFFLYCFPYSYRSYKRKVTVIFSLSPLWAKKSDNYRYRNSWKNNNFRERAIKKKQRYDIKKDAKRIKSDNFKKSPILLSQFWKLEWLDGTIIISYVGGSNIFSPSLWMCQILEKKSIFIFILIDTWLKNYKL